MVPIELSDPPDPAAWTALGAALDRHNAAFAGPADPRQLVLLLRDEAGQITGGLWGRTLYQWLWIWYLVVPEALRGQGVGTALIRRAEQEALARGCRGSLLDTFSFQARPFYERLGYQVFGQVDDFPPGHQAFFLQRRLA